MKPIHTFSLVLLLAVSCQKEQPKQGTGFEIYLTETPYTCNLMADYSGMDFDTIILQSDPILLYRDLLAYDTLSHKMTLNISHDSLHIGDTPVYGRMMVVTLDKEPIYCAFKWSVMSSVGCNWVFIAEPFEELDGLEDNELVISFAGPAVKDPRLDERIMVRLKQDGKIE